MFNPEKIIQILNKHQIEYIVIGGVAASLHGCPEQTYDIDILYNNTEENKNRLLKALNEIEAKWDVPMTSDVLNRQFVFAFYTKYGDLDIFNYVTGLGYYDDAIKYKEIAEYSNMNIQILNLEGLIKSKEAIIEEERNPRKLSAFEYIKNLYNFKEDKGI